MSHLLPAVFLAHMWPLVAFVLCDFSPWEPLRSGCSHCPPEATCIDVLVASLRWYEFGMPISQGPAGGHKSQERGFLLSSVARLETGSRQGAEAGVLFRPTPRVGGGFSH